MTPHTHLSLRWVWYVVQADLQLRIFLPQLSECEVVREGLCFLLLVLKNYLCVKCKPLTKKSWLVKQNLVIRTSIFLFFEMKFPVAQAGSRLTYVAENGLAEISYCLCWLWLSLSKSRRRASLQLVCLHQPFPFSLPSSFTAHTCIIPLGFKTLIYPGFIGEIFVVVAFKL